MISRFHVWPLCSDHVHAHGLCFVDPLSCRSSCSKWENPEQISGSWGSNHCLGSVVGQKQGSCRMLRESKVRPELDVEALVLVLPFVSCVLSKLWLLWVPVFPSKKPAICSEGLQGAVSLWPLMCVESANSEDRPCACLVPVPCLSPESQALSEGQRLERAGDGHSQRWGMLRPGYLGSHLVPPVLWRQRQRRSSNL